MKNIKRLVVLSLLTLGNFCVANPIEDQGKLKDLANKYADTPLYQYMIPEGYSALRFAVRDIRGKCRKSKGLGTDKCNKQIAKNTERLNELGLNVDASIFQSEDIYEVVELAKKAYKNQIKEFRKNKMRDEATALEEKMFELSNHIKAKHNHVKGDTVAQLQAQITSLWLSTDKFKKELKEEHKTFEDSVFYELLNPDEKYPAENVFSVIGQHCRQKANMDEERCIADYELAKDEFAKQGIKGVEVASLKDSDLYKYRKRVSNYQVLIGKVKDKASKIIFEAPLSPEDAKSLKVFNSSEWKKRKQTIHQANVIPSLKSAE